MNLDVDETVKGDGGDLLGEIARTVACAEIQYVKFCAGKWDAGFEIEKGIIEVGGRGDVGVDG